MLFVLGLKAPGIMQTTDYFSLNDSTNNVSPQVSLKKEFLKIFSLVYSYLFRFIQPTFNTVKLKVLML